MLGRKAVVEVDTEEVDRRCDRLHIASVKLDLGSAPLVFGEDVLGVLPLEDRIEEPAVLEPVPERGRCRVLGAVGIGASGVEVRGDADSPRWRSTGSIRLDG